MAGRAQLQHNFQRDGSFAARLTLRLRNCSDAAVSVCVEAGASQQSAGAIPMHADILHASMQLPMLAISCMVGQPQAMMSCHPPIASAYSMHYNLQSVACHAIWFAEEPPALPWRYGQQLENCSLKLSVCWCAASAVWRSIPPAPAASSASGQSTVPEPVAGRAALGCPAGPDYTWTGSTRSLLPELRPGQSAEVPLEVRICIKSTCFIFTYSQVALHWVFGEVQRPWTAPDACDPHGWAACVLSCASCSTDSVCLSHAYACTPRCLRGNLAWQETLDLSSREHMSIYADGHIRALLQEHPTSFSRASETCVRGCMCRSLYMSLEHLR